MLKNLILTLTLIAGLLGAAQPARAAQPADLPEYTRSAVVDVGLLGSQGTLQVVLELQAEPVAVVYADAMQQPGGRLMAPSAALKQHQLILHAQQGVLKQLAGLPTQVDVLYRTQQVYNGIALQVDAAALEDLVRLPGVKAIHRLIAKQPDNAGSVPWISAPEVWVQSTELLGTGIKVGVIDTGIDYLHTDFGGPGTGYATNDVTLIGDAPNFPGVKIAGGWDFVGDTYDGLTAGHTFPMPDPDPMDCYNHGTHVAGTLGGYGVNADGSTYTGDYTNSLDFSTFRIGPGVAPQVTLYALKVFGCTGESFVIDQAIEWAVDPNGDGDPSDHLDVINLSLGSPYGSDYDTTSVAADNAALAGVIVVASAGNNGDTHYVTGSPASATRAISVAAATDPLDIRDAIDITAPASLVGLRGANNSISFNWNAVPNTTGDVVYPASGRSGCAPFTANTFNSRIALLDWTHIPEGSSECSTATRINNAANAGAIGVVLAFDRPYLDTTFFGSTRIPAAVISHAAGVEIKAQMPAETVTVRLTKQYKGIYYDYEPSGGDTLASFTSRGPQTGNSLLKPDLAAPGVSIYSASARSGNKATALWGTSMAAPHAAGTLALLRQLHPTWKVEELKALLINTANHDIRTNALAAQTLAPSRVGAGRMDALQASQADVIALSAFSQGAVSVSFGTPEVLESYQASKTVKVMNKSIYGRSYTLDYTPALDLPGVDVEILDMAGLPITTLDVMAGESVSIQLRLTATASQMKHNRDASMTTLQDGQLRYWMAEETGLLNLTPISGLPPYTGTRLRLPVYAAPRPASAMSAPDFYYLDAPSGTLNVPLSGMGVNTGTHYPEDVTSLVSAYELLASSPNLGGMPPTLQAADLAYVSVMSDRPERASTADAMLYFAVVTHGAWSTPNAVTVALRIDVNRDGVDDFELRSWNYAQYQEASNPTDTFLSVLRALPTQGRVAVETHPLNGFTADGKDTAIFNSNVMILPVSAAGLGLTDANSKFTFRVSMYAVDNGAAAVDSIGGLTYDAAAPAVRTTGGHTGMPVYADQPGLSVPVYYNKNGGGLRDILLVHHHNTSAERTEVIRLRPQRPSLVFGSPSYVTTPGQPVTLQVDVTHSDYAGVPDEILGDIQFRLTPPAGGSLSGLTLQCFSWNGAVDVPLGSITLAPGQTSFWLSNFSPLQRHMLKQDGNQNHTFHLRMNPPLSYAGKQVGYSAQVVSATALGFNTPADWYFTSPVAVSQVVVDPPEIKLYLPLVTFNP